MNVGDDSLERPVRSKNRLPPSPAVANASRSVLQALPFPFVLLSADGWITDANSAAETFFGLSLAVLDIELLTFPLISGRLPYGGTPGLLAIPGLLRLPSLGRATRLLLEALPVRELGPRTPSSRHVAGLLKALNTTVTKKLEVVKPQR